MSWAPKQLTHTQRVTRLYRRSLKDLLSWAIDRPLWREKALELRDRFDANKAIKDPRVALKVLEEGEAEYQKYRHPQPYIRMCNFCMVTVLVAIFCCMHFQTALQEWDIASEHRT